LDVTKSELPLDVELPKPVPLEADELKKPVPPLVTAELKSEPPLEAPELKKEPPLEIVAKLEAAELKRELPVEVGKLEAAKLNKELPLEPALVELSKAPPEDAKLKVFELPFCATPKALPLEAELKEDLPLEAITLPNRDKPAKGFATPDV